jgi:DNA-binding CsgD family transcriptional regulator
VPLVPGIFSERGVLVTGYTLSGRHLRALRDVIGSSKVIDPQLALSWELLESLRTLLGCDHIMIEGCDYGQQSSYFSQRLWAGETWFAHEVDKVEKARFWQLVLRSSNVEPFIPAHNEPLVARPTDFRSLRDWRNMPVYAESLRQGPGTTYELFLQIPDGYRRQLRLIGFRESGRDFNERERFDLELLALHIEGSYRRGETQRVRRELTPRQYSLVRKVSEGWTNQQIARRMGLAEGTVRTHLNNIYARLGVGSRTEAVTRVFGPSRHEIPHPPH